MTAEKHKVNKEQRFLVLAKCEFLGTEDAKFYEFVEQMPNKHWSKYDLSAVRLGWEAHKLLHT